MSKLQKIWLSIFGAMFVVPELIFLILPSSIIDYFSGKNLISVYSFFVDSHFFINNWFYFPRVLAIELIGLVGLLIISIKARKKIFSILLAIILAWLLFVFFIGSLSNSINL